MPYEADDPRAVLTQAAPSAPATPTDPRIAAPEFLDFSITAPDVTTAAGTEQWIVRGQNFVLIYTQPAAGDQIWDSTLGTEQVVLLIDEHSRIEGWSTDAASAGQPQLVDGPALIVVPPGASKLVSTGTGPIVQLIESGEREWADRASNAASYAEPHPRVALLEPWPEPVGGYRWRAYRKADLPVDPKRFGPLYRTRSFMVNFFGPASGPRDPHKMSPHFHDDFEQCSLVVQGTYIHHIQTPWGADMDNWRATVHGRVGSPSVTIIPPPTIHTSQSMAPGLNHLIDIFCGPRHDFSAQPGWVLNADEYPAPPAP